MSDFRKRILEPLLIPLSAFVFVGGIGFGLSRMLLSTTADGASVVALVAALAILTASGVIASRGFRAPEKLAAGLAFVAIVAGGSVFAATIGIRPIEKHAPEPVFTFTAVNAVSFEQDSATVPAADEIAIRFTNNDPTNPHNWGLQTDPTFAAAPPIVEPGGPVDPGSSRDYLLEGVEAGTYFYFCFIHPNMKGTLTIGEGGGAPPPPPPTSAPPSPSAPPPSPSPSASQSQAAAPVTSVTIVAKDIAFDKKELTLAAGKKIDVTFDNQDAGVPHNFAIYTVDLSKKIFETKIITGVASESGSFTAPAPGEYTFKCDVHPQMTGPVNFR